MYADNTACIEWGNNVIGGRERAKHLDIQKYFGYEVIQNGHMKLVQIAPNHGAGPRDSAILPK